MNIKPKRVRQVRPLFLAVSTGVFGLALVGLLIVAFQDHSTNGLILGMGVLFVGALGGLGLGLLFLLGRPESNLGGRRPNSAVLFAFLGAAVGAMSSPAWSLRRLQTALAVAANNPLLWIASVGIGLTVSALVGVLIWRIRPLW